MFLSKAFVTFKTFTAATTARQVVHMQLAGRMAVSEAPEPSDIIWQNMYTTRKGDSKHLSHRVYIHTCIHIYISILPGQYICYLIAANLSKYPTLIVPVPYWTSTH